ncbi:hypothetical protein BDZ97DRAFT_1920671 [Flammula alnicola]|nr:hypothetical protein BDZ97DRAFT_1920671 [Flammula alnicola]
MSCELFVNQSLYYARRLMLGATRLDPKDPKYASNLSAAYYEQGKYISAVKSVVLAWQILRSQRSVDGKPATPPPTDILGIKLATRFAKAKMNGFANKTIARHESSINVESAKEANQKQLAKVLETDIDKFVMLERPENVVDAKIDEMRMAWQHLRSIRDDCSLHTPEQCGMALASSEARLRGLHIFKSASDPTMELFKFGHDRVRSILDGVDNETGPDSKIFNLRHELENFDRLSFLFGGSGDARHVFGTLIHFMAMVTHKGFPRSELQPLLRIHLCLVDIHPATIARTLVMLAIIEKVLQTRKSGDETRRAELHATLFYVLMAALMPDYCCKIVMDVSQELASNLPLGTHCFSEWVHVNGYSVSAVVEVLRYWSNPLPKSTKVFIQRIRQMLPKAKDSNALRNYNDGLCNSNNADSLDKPYSSPIVEGMVYDLVTVLLPPRSLLTRHPALAALLRTYRSAPAPVRAAAMLEIEKNWKPSPVIFDKYTTENPEFGGEGGYPLIHSNPYDTLLSFSDFIISFYSPPFAKSGASIMNRFFEVVADSIDILKGNIKMELVATDVITGIPKLLAGDFGRRPEGSPANFTRMWLSNVPDYTNGILNTAVHLVPRLQPNGVAVSNVLLNTGSYGSINEFCYNHTLLYADNLPRFLGCQVMNGRGAAKGDVALLPLPLPRPLDQLASRKELETWLAHLLLCTLCSGRPRLPPYTIRMPSNLSAYFHVLVYLNRVGFLSHWISDFVQCMLSDTLVADVAPYLDLLPTPLQEAKKRVTPRKVHLYAWQAELQVILSSVKVALPFSIILPQDYPTFDDVRTYKATVRPIDIRQNPLLYPLSSPFIASVGLIFYEPRLDINGHKLAAHVPDILEGKSIFGNVQVQIMLSQEAVNLRTGEISWKMSRSWNEKMVTERWNMVAYRTDLSSAVTEPLRADKWQAVSA